MSNFSLQQLIDNTSHWDKDERYMATNDLCNFLNKDTKLDEHTEQKICNAVLKQLDDQSNDVQSVAVKCLAILLKKVHQNQIQAISKKLSELVVDGKDALRDIYSIGLKTLVADVPSSMGPVVSQTLTVKLLSGINKANDDVKRECLDIFAELLKRFGHLNEASHHDIMAVVVEQLKHEKAVIRKRAGQCLAALAVVSSNALLEELMKILLKHIHDLLGKSSGVTSQDARTYIQTIGMISRMVGYRLGKYLDQMVPLFIKFCGDPEDESHHNDASNEIRESCFPGLESFVLRCPKEVTPFLRDILRVSIAFMKYDPNYCYDEDENDGDDAMDVDEDEEDYGDDDDYAGSEDDDSSWKVRKAAVKVIQAVIQGHPHMNKELYGLCGDELVRRFKEREENVQLDVINCFTKLIEVTYNSASNGSSATSSSSSSSSDALFKAPELKRQTSALELLSQRVDSIVSASCVQLQTSKSLKTKAAILQLLQNLIQAVGGGLDRHMQRIANNLEKLLEDKNQSLKLDALHCLRVCYQHHEASVLFPTVDKILPLVVKIVGQDWYKTIAEALRVLGSIVRVIRPFDNVTNTFSNAFAYQKYVSIIYSSILKRLEAVDIDIEIKECAISSMALVISHLGDHLQAESATVLSLFHRRLDNDTTRTATLKALSTIATTNSTINLSTFLSESSKDLSSFLKQHSRMLRQLTVQTLHALANHASVQIHEAEAAVIIQESAHLLGDDLHLSHLTLQLTKTLVLKNAAAGCDAIAKFSYNSIIAMARAATTQGSALQSLIALLNVLVQTPAFAFHVLFQELYTSSLVLELNKQSVSNLSKAIAAVCQGQNASIVLDSMRRFATDAQSANDLVAQLALLCIGEVGQHADLSSMPELKDLLLSCFERSSEDVKLASAYALGHVAVGSMQTFLPLILQSVGNSKQARQQYLLLASLRELIVVFSNDSKTDFSTYLTAVLPVLLQQNTSEEDSVRNMVAECIGLLTTMTPQQIAPVVNDLLTKKDDKLALRTGANALRASSSRHLSAEAFNTVANLTLHALPLLQDEDLEVKKSALLFVNTAAHHNGGLVHGHIQQAVFPVLISTLTLKLERTVDLGPFKHKVDDNLPLRKLCLSILGTILESMPDRFDANAVMGISTNLLTDNDDVKVSFLQILPRVCDIASGAVAVKVDDMIPSLDKAIERAAKDADKGGRDILKVIVRTILHMNRAEDVKQLSRNWQDFVEKVRKSPATIDLVTVVESEIQEAF